MIALDDLVTRATAAEYSLILATCDAVRQDVLKQLNDEYYKMLCDALHKSRGLHDVDQRAFDALSEALAKLKAKFEI